MWKKIGERLGYEGWRKIKVKEFELPDGRRMEFDILSNFSFVTVAAFTQQGEAILIRQFRPGPERELRSFCEGAIDPGENPIQSARRELLEETGYEAGEMTFLKSKNSAYTDQTQYIFLATDCRWIQAPQPDGGEFLTVEVVTQTMLKKLLLDPEEDTFTNVDAAYLALAWLEIR